MHDGATGQTTSYTPNHLNQYTAVTGQAAPSYDEKFNLSGYDGWTYVYDAEKRLVSANTAGHSAQFVFDGLGRCVKRTIDGAVTVFTYDEWKPIVEWTGGGVFVAWNLYGPGADEILVRYQPNTGGHVHYHLDALGNVQFLLSGEAHLGLEKYTYDVFGKPTITGWNGDARPISLYGNRFLFTGREYLYTLGIYDYRHRKYHPRLGRFMQVDPIGFKGDSLNLYRYCRSNPVNRTDPLGLDSSIYLIRDYQDRDAPGDYIIYDRGKRIDGGRANVNPFHPGKHGVRAGPYTLQPKGKEWGAGRFPANQPAITGSAPGLKPGQPNKTYVAPALVHYEGGTGQGRPDSDGCVTVNPRTEQLTTEIVNRNAEAGETTHFYIEEKSTDVQVRRAQVPEREKPAGSGGLGGADNGSDNGDGRRVFDAHGSTTPHAAEWAKTWSLGGWLATDRT
jgi:RHS repeat-associated protein